MVLNVAPGRRSGKIRIREAEPPIAALGFGQFTPVRRLVEGDEPIGVCADAQAALRVPK